MRELRKEDMVVMVGVGVVIVVVIVTDMVKECVENWRVVRPRSHPLLLCGNFYPVEECAKGCYL